MLIRIINEKGEQIAEHDISVEDETAEDQKIEGILNSFDGKTELLSGELQFKEGITFDNFDKGDRMSDSVNILTIKIRK